MLAVLRSAKRTVELWDLETGRVEVPFPPLNARTTAALCWNADGSLLAAGEGFDAAVWHVPSRRRVATLKGHQSLVVRLLFHPELDLLFSSAWDRTTRLWESTSGRQLLKAQGYLDTPSPDGRFLSFFSGLDAGVWEVAVGRECAALHGATDGPGPLLGVAFSPDGRWAAAPGNYGIFFWDLATLRQRLPAGRQDPRCLLPPAGR